MKQVIQHKTSKGKTFNFHTMAILIERKKNNKGEQFWRCSDKNYITDVTPASGVGTTSVVLATARYYRSVLPLGTTATVRDYRPWRWYWPSTTASGLPPLVCPYVTRGDKLSAIRRGPITSPHAAPAPLLVYIRSCI